MSTRARYSSSTKRQFWQKHISDWRSSGLSQRLYCEKHCLAVQTFGYWHRKLKQENESTPRFFPIAVSTMAVSKPVEPVRSLLELNVCNSRFSIKICSEFDAATLHRLILSLEAMPCSDLARM